jgi:hypothetical protein
VALCRQLLPHIDYHVNLCPPGLCCHVHCSNPSEDMCKYIHESNFWSTLVHYEHLQFTALNMLLYVYSTREINLLTLSICNDKQETNSLTTVLLNINRGTISKISVQISYAHAERKLLQYKLGSSEYKDKPTATTHWCQMWGVEVYIHMHTLTHMHACMHTYTQTSIHESKMGIRMSLQYTSI